LLVILPCLGNVPPWLPSVLSWQKGRVALYRGAWHLRCPRKMYWRSM
jgi:hypothetical protein